MANKVHRSPINPQRWDRYFLNETEFEAEKFSVTDGDNQITFLPNYEEDEDGKIVIENCGGLEYYDIVKEIEKWMDYAAKLTLKSPCAKCQRAAVVVKNNDILAEACNGLTSGKKCPSCSRLEDHTNMNFETCLGQHAEGAAIDAALQKQGSLKGARLYYIKRKYGNITPSGDIACTQCSRKMVESRISEFVIWHLDKNLSDYASRGGMRPWTAHFVIYPPQKVDELAKCFVEQKKKELSIQSQADSKGEESEIGTENELDSYYNSGPY